ncbi:MAG: NAD nucleotidase [Desulfocapsa sp.]|uniref:NAD nucleotidase n=1 Tax=Desulfotalea psychrophila TaxID=84980 RepID=A0ABS3ASN6_9BACT|nr:NAD nucleotidase [Desulfocapsa sp.]MBN4068124.1 NAD nucleotidase [Desulfotalea psychrophila]
MKFKSGKYIQSAAVTAAILFGGSAICQAGALDLRLIHMNDIHSHLASKNSSLYLNGEKTYVEMGGMPRATTMVNILASEKTNHLILNAGDTFQGTLFYSLFKGDATATMMNQINWDAIVLGNHEFDDGDAHLANYLDKLNAAIVAANVVPASGNVLEGKWSPYIIKEIGGERVGIIGIDVKQKTRESSQPSDEITFLDEVTTAQHYADILRNDEGVDKIILLSHYGLSNDIDLARQVDGIDVIIGGDSHSLLGDLSDLGLSSSHPYPINETSLSGEPVCIAQAWDYAKMVGSLDVNFDDNGVVSSCSGNSILLLGDSFKRKNENGQQVEVSPAERAAIDAVVDELDNVAIVSEDAAAVSALQVYQDQVDELKNEVVGQAAEDLSHIRIPGSDYLGNNGNNFPLGSEIAPLVAKSFYNLSLRADACIQNAGGVRTNVASGDVSIDTAYTLLPFSNTLFEIEMKGSEIKQVLEDAISNYYDYGGSSGSFPYAYALKYDINMANPINKRIMNLEIKNREIGDWSIIDPDKLYVIVTNSYIASGKDGYRTFKTVQDLRGSGTDTYLDYAMSFVNMMQSLTDQGSLLRPLPQEEHCIKSYVSGHDFRVTPYLQNPTKDGMTILWMSETSEEGAVEIAGIGRFSSEPVLAADLAYHPTEIEKYFNENDPGAPYLHRVRIEGLTAGTSYDYTVHQGSSSYIGTLKTAPERGVDIRFIVYADSETEPESTGKTRRCSAPYGDFDRQYWLDQTEGYAINIQAMATRKPDFIGIVGDLVEAGNEQRDWDEFWQHNAGRYNNIGGSVPIFPAVGNHENHAGSDGGGGFYTAPLAKDAVARYRTYFETPDNESGKPEHQDRYYRIDFGPVTYITIDGSNGNPNKSDQDTNWYLHGEGETSADNPDWGEGEAPDFNPGSKQYQWLEEQLADAQKKSRFTFVQFHHSPYSVGPHGFNPGAAGLSNGEDTQSGVPMRVLTPLFNQYGVDAVFGGHDEMYEHSLVDGIHFFDVGIGGDGLRGPYMGEDGKYDYPGNNPNQIFLAHLDAPETWEGNQLVDGGKHYGHLEVNIRKTDGVWEAELTPVYVFPLMDENGGIQYDISGNPLFERRIYDDVTQLNRSVSDVDGDGDTDRNDIAIVRKHMRQAAENYPNCDIDGDGRITILDARQMVSLCSRPGCAVE